MPPVRGAADNRLRPVCGPWGWSKKLCELIHVWPPLGWPANFSVLFAIFFLFFFGRIIWVAPSMFGLR
jgi:hypothetical protein